MIVSKGDNSFSAIIAIFVAIIVLPFIGFLNSYIFQDRNVIFLFCSLCLAAFVVFSHGRSGFHFFPTILMALLGFVSYMWIRLNDKIVPPLAESLSFDIMRHSGYVDIFHQFVFFGIFIAAGNLYRLRGFSLPLWLVICGYILGYMARNSTPYQLEVLYHGYNISPGITVFSLLPFVFLNPFKKKGIYAYLPHGLFFLCCCWVFIIRARGPLLGIIAFFVFYLFWPTFCVERRKFLLVFWGLVAFLGLLLGLYMFITNSAIGYDVNEFSRTVFNKSIFTRSLFWNELFELVASHPLVGFGTEKGSYSFMPVFFIARRDNLASHSMYIELLIRLGAVGLILYLLIFFMIWRIFWIGRDELAVRVAGSYLLASLIFAASGQYWIFIGQLKSAFSWALLGIGAGASLRVQKDNKSEQLRGEGVAQVLR